MKMVDRQAVWNKYGCRCAYCGEKIELKQMQVDHIFPKHHAHWLDSPVMMKDHLSMLNKDIDDPSNLNPACRVCNNWKHTWTVEEFRREIQLRNESLEKYSASYRMAKRYGLIQETGKRVEFYFEVFNRNRKDKEKK